MDVFVVQFGASLMKIQNYYAARQELCTLLYILIINFNMISQLRYNIFIQHSHSSINLIRLKEYLRGSSPNKLQNSRLCFVLLIMYIIQRTSCLKQKNFLTALCNCTIHNYKNYVPWHRDTSSHNHCTSMHSLTINLNPWSLSIETDSRSVTQAIPCLLRNRKVHWCLPYCTILPPDQRRNQFNSSPHLQL